jgi:hypothetical protein
MSAEDKKSFLNRMYHMIDPLGGSGKKSKLAGGGKRTLFPNTDDGRNGQGLGKDAKIVQDGMLGLSADAERQLEKERLLRKYNIICHYLY